MNQYRQDNTFDEYFDFWECACEARDRDKNDQNGLRHTKIFDDIVSLSKRDFASFLPRAIDRIAKIRSDKKAQSYDLLLRQIVNEPPQRPRRNEWVAYVDAWTKWADDFQLAWRKA